MIYEFINMSDKITFIAPNDAIAWATTVLFSQGKAGCHREDGTNLNSILVFHSDPEKVFLEMCQEILGDTMENYISKTENEQEIANALLSFAYTSISERSIYDKTIELLQDPEEIEQFKKEHEESKRTSMSQWVLGAWQYGKQLQEQLQEQLQN